MSRERDNTTQILSSSDVWVALHIKACWVVNNGKRNVIVKNYHGNYLHNNQKLALTMNICVWEVEISSSSPHYRTVKFYQYVFPQCGWREWNSAHLHTDPMNGSFSSTFKVMRWWASSCGRGHILLYASLRTRGNRANLTETLLKRRSHVIFMK